MSKLFGHKKSASKIASFEGIGFEEEINSALTFQIIESINQAF